jgi:hypothetical protein
MKKLLLILFLLPTIVFGRKFYISSSGGNDAYTYLQAQNPSTPWKSLKTVTCFGSSLCNDFQCFGTYPNKAAAGDTFLFKRGDLFANGWTYYSSFFWMNYAPDGYSCPSGTRSAPIVFTNYGTGELPNLLYPTSTIATNSSRQVFELGGVTNIIIDGLQFNENRGTFNIQDKANPAPTRAAIWLGTNVGGTWQDTTVLARKVKECIVRNCVFNNVSFAIGSLAGIRCEIYNNTITNLKTCTDTSGTYDVGAGAFEGLNGYFNSIHHNYVKGAWAKSGRVSSTFGLLGVGCDIFNLKYSSITYNTFVDCSGAWEIGNIDQVDSNAGAQYDTFAYNKVINCSQLGYVHGAPGDPFMGKVKSIYNWNNVVINNNTSRMNGPNFGYDLYNDGQSFSGNLAGQYAWWFFRSPLKCPDNALPISDQTWSNPTNPSWCNVSGHRATIQYSTDAFSGNPDTIVDVRNNIFYATTGDQMIYDVSRTKFKHRNNIYYIKGAFLNPTTLGGTLGTGEFNTTSRLFVDTSAALPENWDLHLSAGSLGIGAGTNIPSLTTDFAGNALTNPPSIGLYNYSAPTSVAVAPTVTTAAAVIGSATSATLGGNVTADGGATVYRRGVIYSTSATVDSTSITGGGKLIVTSTGLGAYTIPTGTLVRGTTYYARAFALNSAGVSYGGEVSFTTLNIPTIATTSPTAIAQTTAVSGGVVSTDGNSAIIKRGLIYSTSAITDTSNGTKIINATASTGAFTSNLSGLASNTLYHVRAFAYNAVGIAYGSDLTFTTTGQIISPIVVSSTATTINCNGDSSTVVITASGGVAPYTGTGTFKRVAGTYTFTVTDGYTNSGSKVVTITQPTLIVATVTFAPVTTIGGTTTVTAASTGGTGNKLYAIDGGAYQSSVTFAGVTAGAHTLSVTDANACIVSKAFTVNTTTQATKSALKFKN